MCKPHVAPISSGRGFSSQSCSQEWLLKAASGTAVSLFWRVRCGTRGLEGSFVYILAFNDIQFWGPFKGKGWMGCDEQESLSRKQPQFYGHFGGMSHQEKNNNHKGEKTAAYLRRVFHQPNGTFYRKVYMYVCIYIYFFFLAKFSERVWSNPIV